MCNISRSDKIMIKNRRDSHKYFMDFDQLLHDYSETPKNPCKAVNAPLCIFRENQSQFFES